jgi:hypothetical protein
VLAHLLCAALCAAAPADTTLTLSRPAMVAFFGATPAMIERQPGLVEVLADFQFSLGRARRDVEALELEVHEVYDSTITLRTPSGDVTLPVGDRLPIGYFFWSPDGPAYVCRGVRIDSDIVAEARNYLEALRTGAFEPLARCERVP